MSILSLAAASVLQAASPAPVSLPVLVDPETVLSDLHDARSWRVEASHWDNRGQGRRKPWDWELKITYGVRADGRLMNCNVVSPSGYDAFDQAACAALLAKARVTPNLDSVGKAVRSSGEVTYRLRYRPAMICGTGLDEEEQ